MDRIKDGKTIREKMSLAAMTLYYTTFNNIGILPLPLPLLPPSTLPLSLSTHSSLSCILSSLCPYMYSGIEIGGEFLAALDEVRFYFIFLFLLFLSYILVFILLI